MILTVLRTLTRPRQFTVLRPAPPEAIVHGRGTDIEGSLPVLWALVVMTRPVLILELGTRLAVSTRTLAAAAALVDARVITVDPDPACEPFVSGLPRTIWMNMTGEALFAQPTRPIPDLLFIDTDPHTYEQTTGWLETWVTAMPSGSVVAFHDIYPARDEIQVTEAVEDFLVDHPGYIWHKLATDACGLGLLWVP